MSKRKFIYNLLATALATWNTTRIVRGMNDQADAIARKVTMEMAKQKVKTRREGKDAVAGIARDVFAELIDTPARAAGEGPIVPIDEMMLGDALGAVVERTLS